MIRTGVRPVGGGRMITRVSSVGVRVGDQDRAVDFYVTTLGFEKRRDEPMGHDGRWVEVAPAGAETALVPFTPGWCSPATTSRPPSRSYAAAASSSPKSPPPSRGAAGPSSGT